MQAASFESAWPVMGKMMWQRNYEAVVATPMSVSDVVFGELGWIAIRLTTIGMAFVLVMTAFGIPRSPLVILAIPSAVLTGLAFAAPIIAFSATLTDANPFNVLFRFVITPLFMFSGVFVPVSRLPEPVARAAWFTPLFHGVELVRGFTLGAVPPAWPIHVTYLIAHDCRGRRGGAGDVPAETLRMIAIAVPSPRRSLRMVQRNLLVYKYTWMVIFSGFFEPLFYLLGIGLGLGAIVPPIDGISYSAYVAPGLLASSCLNGAITDGFFNMYWKLHYQKTYDGILATPMRVPDVAFGEMLWALGRGSLYAAVFLTVLFALGAVTGGRCCCRAGRWSRGRRRCCPRQRFPPWRSS